MLALILPMLLWFLFVAMRSTRPTWRAYVALLLGAATIVALYAMKIFVISSPAIPTISS